MSNITHLFDLNIESTEHHLISKSPNLTITAESAAGEANTFMASKYGAYNHVAGFETTVDKIKVPLEVIKEANPDTALVKGPCPAAKYDADPVSDGFTTYKDAADAGRYLRYTKEPNLGEAGEIILLTLDGDPAPTLVAGDIEIV